MRLLPSSVHIRALENLAAVAETPLAATQSLPVASGGLPVVAGTLSAGQKGH